MNSNSAGIAGVNNSRYCSKSVSLEFFPLNYDYCEDFRTSNVVRMFPINSEYSRRGFDCIPNKFLDQSTVDLRNGIRFYKSQLCIETASKRAQLILKNSF